MRSVRRLLAAFAVAAFVASPAFAVTNERVDEVDAEFADPMVDVLVLRPVGLVGLVLSSALWVPAELMTLCVNPTEWQLPVDHLLTPPARFVFVDPIGSH
jgi:hypothetical protein